MTEEGQGKEPIYDFVNKATGEFLAISEEDVVGLQVGEKRRVICLLAKLLAVGHFLRNTRKI